MESADVWRGNCSSPWMGTLTKEMWQDLYSTVQTLGDIFYLLGGGELALVQDQPAGGGGGD